MLPVQETKQPIWAICENKICAIINEGDFVNVPREIIFRQIGAKVAYYRTLRGMSQEKLAEKMNLHKSVLSRIERGKYHNDVSVSTLLDIAEKLQIDPALFLTFSELEKKIWWEHLDLSEMD